MVDVSPPCRLAVVEWLAETSGTTSMPALTSTRLATRSRLGVNAIGAQLLPTVKSLCQVKLLRPSNPEELGLAPQSRLSTAF